MKKRSGRMLFIDITSIIFIALFLYTGITKIMTYDIFKIQSGIHPLLRPYAGFIGIAVPLVELTIAVSLFKKKWVTNGLLASFILMSLFTIYVGGMLLSDMHLPCTCGGVIQAMSWKQHLIFNIVLTGLSGYAFIVSKRNKNEETPILKQGLAV